MTDPTVPLTASAIRRLAVFPPLGIARVGNATGDDDYVFGPEVVGGPCTMPQGGEARYETDFRSADGAIKRQAARFRLYAELTDGDIRVGAPRLRLHPRLEIAINKRARELAGLAASMESLPPSPRISGPSAISRSGPPARWSSFGPTAFRRFVAVRSRT